MRDIKDHKTNAMQLTPYKQLRKPVISGEERKRQKASLKVWKPGGGDIA